jgi:hypothetical protein
VRKVSLVSRRGEANSDERRGGVGGSGSDGVAAHIASDGDETNSANGAAVYACGDAA